VTRWRPSQPRLMGMIPADQDSCHRPQSLELFDAALKACDSEVAALRREGPTRPLSTAEVERLFALGFALDQLFQNAGDLARRIEEYSTGRAA
jgi:hypothetical protein